MPEIKRMRPLLGTFVEVGACGPMRAHSEAAVSAAFEAIEDVQRHLSFHAADSDLSRLNSSAGETVAMHPISLHVLHLARAMMAASGSLFDITVGGALVRRGALPDHGGAAPLERGEVDDLLLGPGWARLRRPVRLTLDGMAKGYAVDLAVRCMRALGIATGWVNAGGDLRAFGDRAVPVQRREHDGRVESLGGLRNAGLASSHWRGPSAAADPDFPGLIVGVAGTAPGVFSVLARQAWRADALTKVACLAPGAVRASLLQRLGGVLVAPASVGVLA